MRIKKRRQAIHKILQQELIGVVKKYEQFSELIENLHEGIWIIDKDAYTRFVNNSMAKILGYTVEEMRGRHLFSFMDAIGVKICKRNLKRRKKGIKEQHEFEFLKKDGTRVYTFMATSPIMNSDKNYIGAIAVVHDITQYKRSEEELLFKNVLLEAESETSPDGILVVDEKGKSIFYNKRFWKIWRIPKKILDIKSDRKMIKYVLSQLKDPKGFVKKVKYLYSHASEKSRDEIEFKDGRVFERYSSPLIGRDGKHYGRIWYFRDISERKRAEDVISHSEIKYRSLVSNIPGVVYRCACDSHWTMEVISNAIMDISGYPASDYIGNKIRSYASIIHPDDKDMVEKTVLDGVKHKEPYIIEYRIIHEDMSVKWVYEKGQGIFDKNGTLLWLDGAIFDITEKKRAEERIKIFMKEFEVSPNSQFVVEYKENKPFIMEVNKTFLNYYGFTRKEIIGQNPRIINSGKQTKEYYEKMWDSLLNPKIGFWTDEIVNKRKDGSFIDVILTISTIFDEKNNPVFFVASHVDITKRKQMENQLGDTNIELKKQNMALVKSSIELAEAKRDVEEKNIELIALASHEMKTPLTSVTSIVELMLDGNIGKINEKQKEGLKIASHDLHRLDLIIKNMVDVSRVEGDTVVYEFSEFNIIDLINGCIKTAESMLKEKNIKIELKDGHYCNVNADKTKIEQVVLNLITNAIKYGNENGHIWITVKSERYAVLLEFRDDGKGISEKNISKLFTKNFQVRGESGDALGGMGYGLYLSKKILDRHKGEIWVKSELGKGSTFYVLLPIRQKV